MAPTPAAMGKLPRAKVMYTLTDEAPMLATYAWLPIVRAFAGKCDMDVELKDISVAGRVLAAFPEAVPAGCPPAVDGLAELGALAKTPDANIVKLPNISASIPQLQQCIAELQAKGFKLPEYPQDPQTDAEREIKQRYSAVLGSAVNPVLREGNSDRRAAGPVKEYAKRHPHSMGKWSPESKTHVAHMSDGDFFGSERSTVAEAPCEVRIELVPSTSPGAPQVLKAKTKLTTGEVIDAAVMSAGKLREFLRREIEDAKEQGVLFSLHLKATMMKVSDPIMFGHVVSVFYEEVFQKHAAVFQRLGVNANNGIGDVYAKVASLPAAEREAIEADIQAVYKTRPGLAMVDSDKGITNLHVPSDVIIDASMPAMIRASGKMWTAENTTQDTKAVIPDRCYAGVFQVVIDDCKKNGAFDVTKMGTVPNVGLMAQKAEEYGSHDKTFEIKEAGVVRVVDSSTGNVLLEHSVGPGDIWRMCQTKDIAIKDWVKLAVTRARATSAKAVFWLDPERAHDAAMIKKVRQYLPEHPGADSLDIDILPPVEACRLSCERARAGLDTISVTGNVLRDYNTDLFPILELGTSAKMLSIVPLLAGGGMYETGAGGSAPKHVQQFVHENHLRWDSLGEYLALAVSFEDVAAKGNRKADVLARALNNATTRFLSANKNPSRKVREIDNRGSHFYMALYWAQELAKQEQDSELQNVFQDIASQLEANEQQIVEDFIVCQGKPVEIGGYYRPDEAMVEKAMRPSASFNAVLDSLSSSPERAKIMYTLTDEAPMLATYAWLPIVRAYAGMCDVDVELKDISVAGRVLAAFPEAVPAGCPPAVDGLAELGALAKTPAANIVKLPNISASIPQLQQCIAELQAKGFKLPEYPQDPQTDAEREIKQRYSGVLGSAVNPVLREGNSDRRAAGPVKEYAKRHPHSMGKWSPDSKTHVAHMSDGDFFGSERSAVAEALCEVRIELVPASAPGTPQVLKAKTKLTPGEIIDAASMSARKLRAFLTREIEDAKEQGVLFSLHLKATMMKVSDPIMFGHVVSVFYEEVFQKHAAVFQRLGVNPNNGLGDVYAKIASLPAAEREAIEADIQAVYKTRPGLAMVDSDRGITNLHVPSDVIIDASMPAMIRGSGKMWTAENTTQDTKAVIPDRCYAGVFQVVIDDCKKNGAFDVTKMGTVPNVGLMAQKAEEYGSHDKTFEMKEAGVVRVVDSSTGKVLLEHNVEPGDIWRMCQTKDVAIKDWVKLAVTRARATGAKAVFWLDPQRAHDAVMIRKVRQYLSEHPGAEGLDIDILPPVEACRLSCDRARAGLDTISVTGNVLRDYNTDLFPILELGTSAKMLSIVPLLAGGGMYETGAGGSAPKHVQQFVQENHLRWDSLGEYLALAVSFEDVAAKGNRKARVLGRALDAATTRFLTANKNPSRKVREIDNRGSHFYMALYWAQELAKQCDDQELQRPFQEVAAQLEANEQRIMEDLIACQGKSVEIGGYYRPDESMVEKAMRPSASFNAILNSIGSSPKKDKVMYTLTDEAPMLATYAWLPIIRAYAGQCDVDVELKDISVAGRVLAAFPEAVPAGGAPAVDGLAELGALAKTPEANIVKLPNISASIPQLQQCIAELQAKGFTLPEYPQEPQTDKEREIKQRYSAVLGSAVNPVLREGNSDRRAAGPVKEYAKRHPHSMGKWSPDSKTHVAHMNDGDFFGSERSTVVDAPCEVRIELVPASAPEHPKVLKASTKLTPGEVIDAAAMSVRKLRDFLKREIEDAKEQGVLFSLHLKATMMKVSDPIMFGHVVSVFYEEVFQKHEALFKRLGVNPNNGLGDVYTKIASLPAAEREAVEADIQAVYKMRPGLAMVDSDKGITNLHVPSDVIIDASMPAMIRASGKMWTAENTTQDTKAVIPDRCYAGVFQVVIDDCKKNGAYDVTKMGTVPNVGLMAQKAEEYGSHDKTFEIKEAGVVRVVESSTGKALLEHNVEPGDIWRMCQTKDVAIKDWVKLAVTRARATGAKAVFWLDPARAHDAVMIQKVRKYLVEYPGADLDCHPGESGLDMEILPPVEACRVSCERARAGLDTISVTGNVLRDYNTDLFPILELGTSAKMLSIVPLLAGGGMYETGAGGSAPKHVQQFVQENHLRWDSLGEYLALAVSFEDLAAKGNRKVAVLAKALDDATTLFLSANKNPSRKVREIDNRGSHFYMALYWAQALAKQQTDLELQKTFQDVASQLEANERQIVEDFIACQGKPVEIGGYYRPDEAMVEKTMRPSATFNTILESIDRSSTKAKIMYTLTDEAPMLATYAWLPIVQTFAGHCDVDVELKDISVAGRVLAAFPEAVPVGSPPAVDGLAELGALAKTPDANIVKLPNISASIPQLQQCIAELQAQGFKLPAYPQDPKTDAEREIKQRYSTVLGSAVNPVLREGNSDRRAAGPVKEYARRHPHSMGKWSPESKTHVAHMSEGDFFGSERSAVVEAPCEVRIELVPASASDKPQVLKAKTKLTPGEVIDAAAMSARKLREFLRHEIEDAKEQNVLFSLHLKATMMKVSDPIMFGHVVSVFYEEVFQKHAAVFQRLGVNPNNGLGDVYAKIASLPAPEREAIEADIQAVYATRPALAMVDSDKGITNLHVPSDVIIDASMPAMIRASGKMWTAENTTQDTKAVIPDRCYAGVFQVVIEDCKKNGAFDVTKMGTVPNVGLMAQKAEEYGSHDKTFEIKEAGVVRVVDSSTDNVLLEHTVEPGDIWRMCQTKDVAIKDWVKLAVARARATGAKAVFWLDSKRSHDATMIEKVKQYLPEHPGAESLDIEILPPVEACRLSCERARAGLDTISVTGNVLRDYNTDLFPILELGTSAKMLSIVPLLAGGGMYETGAGGSAPKHVQQFVQENHLRWDSLGEYLALAVSFEDLAAKGNRKVAVLARALNDATARFLSANKNPSRKVREIDNRGSHFYMALYWAQELAKQQDDPELQRVFQGMASQLEANEQRIAEDFLACQGKPVEIGGYYRPDEKMVEKAMCPSACFNDILSAAR